MWEAYVPRATSTSAPACVKHRRAPRPVEARRLYRGRPHKADRRHSSPSCLITTVKWLSRAAFEPVGAVSNCWCAATTLLLVLCRHCSTAHENARSQTGHNTSWGAAAGGPVCLHVLSGRQLSTRPTLNTTLARLATNRTNLATVCLSVTKTKSIMRESIEFIKFCPSNRT